MPLFSLPLDAGRRPSSRAQLYPRTSQKRKRDSSPQVEFTDESRLPTHDPEPDQASLAAASTNPLSLAPDEILQYKVAGLCLDKELPSKSISDFPHVALPSSYNPDPQAGFTDYGEDDENLASRLKSLRVDRKGPLLRMQHLGVLTTILHRCLLEGDLPRASRAWAMLLRAQVNGKGIDLKGSRYWAIGAELLVRSGEQPSLGHRRFGKDGNSVSENDAEDINSNENAERKDFEGVARSWGTVAGLEKAKDYFERLILQYPYKRQFHVFTNPLDFYPAMFSCEIYGIQYAQKEGLNQKAFDQSSFFSDPSQESLEEVDVAEQDDPDTYFDRQRRREDRKKERRRELFRLKREELKQVALNASEKVAARMDELMVLPPYSDSHVLNRLRGMLALYIGDLNVPALIEDDQEEEGRRWDSDSELMREEGEKKAERRLLERRRRVEHERGLVRRSEERERAKKMFEKVKREGGDRDEALERLFNG